MGEPAKLDLRFQKFYPLQGPKLSYFGVDENKGFEQNKINNAGFKAFFESVDTTELIRCEIYQGRRHSGE